MDALNLLITGAGGQGIILASDIVGETAIAAGYDIKKTDSLGMAQRGGSVISHLRIAEKVFSPLIRLGAVDILFSLEKLEAVRWAHYLKPGGVALINDHALPPLSVSLGGAGYPPDEEVNRILRAYTDRVYLVAGTAGARSLGNPKTMNVFMLGCLSHFMPFPVVTWQETISDRLPGKIKQINLDAFDLGRKELADVHRI